MRLTKDTIKPSDFQIRDHLWNSPFQNCEKEIVARNLILISQWNDDKWFDFTWDEYAKRCKHRVTYGERVILDNFVRKFLLSCDNGVYVIKNAFIQKLAQFIKK